MIVLWFHCAVIRTPLNSICFVHTESAHRGLVFYLIQLGGGGGATALLWCFLVLHWDYLGVLQFSGTLWKGHPGLTELLQTTVIWTLKSFKKATTTNSILYIASQIVEDNINLNTEVLNVSVLQRDTKKVVAVMEYCDKSLYTALCEPQNKYGLPEDEFLCFFRHTGWWNYECLTSSGAEISSSKGKGFKHTRLCQILTKTTMWDISNLAWVTYEWQGFLSTALRNNDVRPLLLYLSVFAILPTRTQPPTLPFYCKSLVKRGMLNCCFFCVTSSHFVLHKVHPSHKGVSPYFFNWPVLWKKGKVLW